MPWMWTGELNRLKYSSELERRVAVAHELLLVDAELHEQARHARHRRLADAHRRHVGRLDQRDADPRAVAVIVQRGVQDHGGEPAGGAAADDGDLGDAVEFGS
jgi:hypothetical protein